MFQVSGQKLQPQQGGNAIYWSGSTFGANQEAYVTLSQFQSDAQELDLLLKLQPGTDQDAIEVLYSPLSQVAQVWTYTSTQGWVQRGADIAVTFAAGDVLGARANAAGQVGVYKNGTLLGARDVTAWPYYASTGYIGIWTVAANNALLDNFGGGTLSGGVAPLLRGPAPLPVSFTGWPSVSAWRASQVTPTATPTSAPSGSTGNGMIAFFLQVWQGAAQWVTSLIEPKSVAMASAPANVELNLSLGSGLPSLNKQAACTAGSTTIQYKYDAQGRLASAR